MKHWKTTRLSWQYFFSYLLVMLTAMICLLVYVYNSFYEFHSQLLLSEYRGRLELLRETQESELTNLMAVNNLLGTRKEAEPFIFAQEPDKGAQLVQEIKDVKATTQYVHSAYLRYYGENYIFSNLSSHSVKNFSLGAVTFENINADQLMDLWEHTTRMTILPVQTVEGYGFGVYGDAQQFLTIFLPFNYLNIHRSGTVMYLINQTIYKNWFSSIINDTADVYILHGDQILVQRNLSGILPEELFAAREAGESILSSKGNRYHFLCIDGDKYDYSYMMLVSDEELRVAMSSSTTLLIVVAAVIASLCALLIMRTVQSRMKPINLLYSMLSDRASTGNELVEIRDGVQRLIDENNTMASRMENLDTLQKSDFAQRFLTGSFESTDQFFMLAENIHLNVDVPCFAVAILAKPPEEEYPLRPEKLNMLFSDKVAGVTRMQTSMDRAVMVLFAQHEEDIFAFLDHRLESMRAMCMGMTIAVSNVHNDYRDGQHAYLEAENAFELRFVKGNAQVIRFSGLKENFEHLPEYNHQLVENLRLAIHGGHPGLVQTTLQEIADYMRGVNTSLFMFRCMYNDILNVVSTEARKNGHISGIYDLFRLSQCLSLNDLDEMLRSACVSLISEKDARQEKDDSPVTQAKEILNQRYFEQDLSISEVAAQVGMSDSSLSRSFKTAYTMTPMEYITSLRMHRARKLLRTTRMPVKDVAIECGYYDISGFNRRFKSYTGMTPQQYRLNSSTEQELEE